MASAYLLVGLPKDEARTSGDRANDTDNGSDGGKWDLNFSLYEEAGDDTVAVPHALISPVHCQSRRHKIEVDLVNYGDDADAGGGNDADDDVDVIYRRCIVLLLLLLLQQ
ncbi:unnamed protein product [Taenia asiatica]|uniref:Uncharacterized protein n=1 Tax=Taenia asiatica TaxID=60517 RepID=A0A0R3W4E8_TAEAS|nr:unnamed protein product [Taenia asiatica]